MRLFYNRSVAIVLVAALATLIGLQVHYVFRDHASGYFIWNRAGRVRETPTLGLSPS